MSHFEVSEESAADRTDKTLVASFCLTDDLFLVRFKQISRPYSKFYSHYVNHNFTICDSQIFNVRPTKSRKKQILENESKQIYQLGVNWVKIWQMNPNYYLM